MALANPRHCSCPTGPSGHVPSSSLAACWGWEWGGGHQAEEGGTKLARGAPSWEGGPRQSHQETLTHKGLGRIRPTVLAAGRH